ncbi:C13 family peptidase [Lampropedia puyangensis]|nr:C13 family peptidase [Lampropedia puyangensis]
MPWTTALRKLSWVALVCAVQATAPAYAQAPAQPSVASTAASPAPDAMSPNGGAYYGPLRNGLMHGQGRLLWRNGDVYEGGFVDGLWSGHGVLRMANGTYYEGQFVDGDFSGQGQLQYADGDVYKGAFSQGEAHGQGRLTRAGGSIVIGTFEKGEPAGDVTVIAPDGQRYEGHMRHWDLTGPGRMVDADGTVVEGVFSGFTIEGKGHVTYADGRQYRGDLVYSTPHGHGVMLFSNGDEYKGMFEHGLMHGAGVMRWAVAQADGRRVTRGQWQEGELLDAQGRVHGQETDAAPDTPAQWQANVDTVLYNQNTLLAKAYAALQPPTPGQTNLYALLVAGDGGQEVFRREVQYVAQLLAERFGAQGRILSLINSRTGVSTTPLATQESLSRSLHALARVMDPERDVLLLFLTSHGSADHQLSLQMKGIQLRNLPAKTLGAMLKDSGIRNKIVVVSACYSGGFIPELADSRTLVVTAARADRTSFGCADENDFTYFGRALFKESMAQTQALTAAFAQAQSLVKQWELDMADAGDADNTADGGAALARRLTMQLRQSEPQISGTPAFREWIDQQWLQWQRPLAQSEQ